MISKMFGGGVVNDDAFPGWGAWATAAAETNQEKNRERIVAAKDRVFTSCTALVGTGNGSTMLAGEADNLLTPRVGESTLVTTRFLFSNYFGRNHLASKQWLQFWRDRSLFPVAIVGTWRLRDPLFTLELW